MTDFDRVEDGGRKTWNESFLRLRDREAIKIVTLCCPQCGRDVPLGDRPVYEDGMVVGVVSCKTKGCGWKDEVRLLGWSSRSP